jgi:hypothetical protein
MAPPKGHKRYGGGSKGKAVTSIAKLHVNAGAAVATGEIMPWEAVMDMTPLAILLTVARRRIARGDEEGACHVALMAAPYCHAKLIQTELRVQNDYSKFSDRELELQIVRERRLLEERRMIASGRVIEVEAEPVA